MSELLALCPPTAGSRLFTTWLAKAHDRETAVSLRLDDRTAASMSNLWSRLSLAGSEDPSFTIPLHVFALPD